MSADTYRAAVARLREVLDLLGPYRGPCGLCGQSADARHRVADAIAGALIAGDDPGAVADDYLPADRYSPMEGREVVLTVALVVTEADRRIHRMTARRALQIEREVYADLETHPTTTEGN